MCTHIQYYIVCNSYVHRYVYIHTHMYLYIFTRLHVHATSQNNEITSCICLDRTKAYLNRPQVNHTLYKAVNFLSPDSRRPSAPPQVPPQRPTVWPCSTSQARPGMTWPSRRGKWLRCWGKWMPTGWGEPLGTGLVPSPRLLSICKRSQVVSDVICIWYEV